MSVYFMRGIMSGEGNRSIIPAVEEDRTRLYHSAVRRLRFLIAITLQVCCANILHMPAASYTPYSSVSLND